MTTCPQPSVVPSVENLESRRLFSVTPALVQIPISSAAQRADARLRFAASFDLRVTVSAGDTWSSAGIHAVLIRGSFYSPQPPDAPFPNTARWMNHPNEQYATFVSSHDLTDPMLSGFGHLHTPLLFSTHELNIEWFNPQPRPVVPRTVQWTIARITVSADAEGFIFGKVGGFSRAESEFSYQGALAGVRSASISGFAFNDLNGDGKQLFERGASHFLVYIDADQDGRWDPEEKSVLTGGWGEWCFLGLAPGTYTIRIAPRSGWKATTTRSFVVTVAAGQTKSGLLFGEHAI